MKFFEPFAIISLISALMSIHKLKLMSKSLQKSLKSERVRQHSQFIPSGPLSKICCKHDEVTVSFDKVFRHLFPEWLKKIFWKFVSTSFYPMQTFFSLGSKLNFSSVQTMHSLRFWRPVPPSLGVPQRSITWSTWALPSTASGMYWYSFSTTSKLPNLCCSSRNSSSSGSSFLSAWKRGRSDQITYFFFLTCMGG